MDITLPADLEISVLTITPKKPFYDWAMNLSDIDEDEKELDLEDFKNDTSAHIVPPIESVDDFQFVLQENYVMIFRNELFGWSQDPKTWPEELTMDLFNNWFDVSLHSMVYDLTPDDETEEAN